MLRRPATRTAAAADAPAGTKIVRLSTMTAMVAGSPSGRGRNIETPCRKEVECRFERAGGDHRRKGVGMGARKGDAAVAVGGEGSRKTLRLVVDRQAVGRHHSERRPGAHDLQLAQPRKREQR